MNTQIEELARLVGVAHPGHTIIESPTHGLIWRTASGADLKVYRVGGDSPFVFCPACQISIDLDPQASEKEALAAIRVHLEWTIENKNTQPAE